jgi:CMP-N,N'-diacetyllegionaminic acid synthase
MIKKKLNKKRVICIICARGGSKSLKNKNILKIGGKPLIAYPIIQAKKSKNIGTVLVTTDSKKIAAIAKKYGAIVPFLRPKELAKDTTTTEDTLKHALLTYEEMINFKFDIGVFLSASDFFRKKIWIDQCVTMLFQNKNIDSVFSGNLTHKNFWELKNKNWKRLKDSMKKYSSRQFKRPIVREDTGLACASRADLWRKGRRIGDRVEIITNNESFSSIDIHDIDDLKLAKAALKIKGVKNFI